MAGANVFCLQVLYLAVDGHAVRRCWPRARHGVWLLAAYKPGSVESVHGHKDQAVRTGVAR